MERKNVHLSINIGFHPLGPAASWSALSLSRAFWTRYLRKGSAFKGQREVTEGLGPVFLWVCSETEPAWLLSGILGLSRRSIQVE